VTEKVAFNFTDNSLVASKDHKKDLRQFFDHLQKHGLVIIA
jgi:hypothetical protein